MSSLVLPLLDAKQMSHALTPHASRDGFTPTLTMIAVGGDHGPFAYATDRYTVGRYDLTNIIIGEVPAEPFLIPAKALAAVGSIGPASLPDPGGMSDYTVRFEESEQGSIRFVTVTVLFRMEFEGEEIFVPRWLRTWATVSKPGNFPPVWNLFDQFLPASRERTHLGGDHLSKFTGYAKAYRLGAIRITLSAAKSEGVNGPVLVEIGNRFKGLIQEYRVLDHDRFGKDLAEDNRSKDEETRRLAEAGEAEGQTDE